MHAELVDRGEAIRRIAGATWLVARSSVLLALNFLGWATLALGFLMALGVAGILLLDWLDYVPLNSHIRMG